MSDFFNDYFFIVLGKIFLALIVAMVIFDLYHRYVSPKAREDNRFWAAQKRLAEEIRREKSK